jgi:hypothetical protein
MAGVWAHPDPGFLDNTEKRRDETTLPIPLWQRFCSRVNSPTFSCCVDQPVAAQSARGGCGTAANLPFSPASIRQSSQNPERLPFEQSLCFQAPLRSQQAL